MRSYFYVTAFIILLANAAQAFPPIVFYNVVAPVPSLELVSIKPYDHQNFDRTTPSPPMVTVLFTQAVDPDQSDLKVFDAFNNPIGEPKQFPKDTSITVALPAKLLSETYRVEWSATCACQGRAVIKGTTYFTMY